MEQNQKNLPLFVVIPSNIFFNSKDFTANDRLIYGYVSALSNSMGYCYALNGYIGDALGLKKDTVSKSINKFIKKGYMRSKLIYKEGSKEVIGRHLYLIINGDVIPDLSDKNPIGVSDKNPIPIGYKSEDNKINIINNNTSGDESPVDSSNSSKEEEANAKASKKKLAGASNLLNPSKEHIEINNYYISKENARKGVKANNQKFIKNINKLIVLGYTIEEIKNVIDYHSERAKNNENSLKYFKPDTIFGVEHFEKSYEFALEWVEKGKKNNTSTSSTSSSDKKYYVVYDNGLIRPSSSIPSNTSLKYFETEDEAKKYLAEQKARKK